MRAFTRLALVAVALIAGGIAVAATWDVRQTQMTGGRVELDIYSGQPNPAWGLSEDDARALVGRLAALPGAPAGVMPDPLGYRGFSVEYRDPATGQATTLRVSAGMIESAAGNVATYRTDVQRQVERWLLSTGRAHLDTETYTLVSQEIGTAAP